MACTGYDRFMARWYRAYVGERIDTGPSTHLTITDVYDYERADESVGIWWAYLTIQCDDGNDYVISEGGQVYRLEDDRGEELIGWTSPLYIDYEM